LLAVELQIVVMIRMPMQVEKELVVATIRRPMNSATDANVARRKRGGRGATGYRGKNGS
jgi:hypothetical protein